MKGAAICGPFHAVARERFVVLAGNARLFEQVRAIELRQMTDQARNEERFEQVFGYIEGKIEPAQRIFFDGQIYDAFSLLASLVEKAEREIVLVDGYVDVGTLNILAKKGDGVAVTLYTRGGGRLSQGDGLARAIRLLDDLGEPERVLTIHLTSVPMLIDPAACVGLPDH